MKGFLPSVIRGRAWGCIAACGLAVALLMSCGGQTSSPAANNDAGQNPGGSGGGVALRLILAGAYQGTVVGSASQFVSFITPDLHLYMLLQVGDRYAPPIIYTGSLQPPVLTSASTVTMRSFQSPGTLLSGSATATGTTALAHTLGLSEIFYIPALNTIPQFTASKMETTASAQGTWTGTWADGLDGSNLSNTSLSLTETPHASTTALTAFGACTSIALTLTPAANASTNPYFAASADIGAAANCLRNPTAGPPMRLTGIAFIHTAPSGVKSLEIIVTDDTGSGMSFRGTQ